MRSRSILMVILMLATALAGCLGNEPPTVEPAPPEPATVEVNRTKTFQLEHSGDAGDWVQVWLPLQQEAESFQMEGHHAFTTSTADPAMAFVVPFDQAVGSQNKTFWGRDRHIAVAGPLDGPISDSMQYRTTFHGTTYIGFYAFYTANVPWSLQIDLTLTQDAVFVDPTTATGSNASFSYDSKHEGGVRLPSGTVQHSATFEQDGWTHMSFYSQNVQPISEREVKVRFAGGFEAQGPSSTFGYCLVLMCSGGYDGVGNQFGVIGNPGGENHGWASFTEAGYGVDIAMVHVAGAHTSFPAALDSTDYGGETFSWGSVGTPPPSM